MAARSKVVAAAAVAQELTKSIAFRATESVPMAPKTVTVDLDAVSHQNTQYVIKLGHPQQLLSSMSIRRWIADLFLLVYIDCCYSN